jgi:hypothetical protein
VKYYKRIDVHRNSASEAFTPLKPILDQVNSPPDTFEKEVDRDRMKWLKYWINHAVKLYGDEAYITFR